MERNILTRINAQLRAAHDETIGREGALHGVLQQNLRLWKLFAADVAASGNGLPEELRASLLSLAAYVERETPQALKKHSVRDTFIAVNDAVIDGLSSEEVKR